MARFLRASTSATVRMGPFVSPSDGVTPYTSTPGTVYLSKAGGAFAARNDATSITHDRDGYHVVTLNATDTGTVGRLRAEVAGSSSNYLPVWEDFVVLDTSVYDVLFGTAPILTTTTDLSGAQVPSSAGAALKAAYSNLDAAISTRSTYAGADTSGTTTLLSRLTSGRAGNLDNLDAAVSTRLATGSYTAAPSASAIATEVLDTQMAETSVSVRKALRAVAAVLAGDKTGEGTASVAFKALGNSGTTRVTGALDEDGNRTVTLNL